MLIVGVFLPWYWVNFYNREELTLNALGWYSNSVKIVPDLELFPPPWTDGLEILLLGVFLLGLTLVYFWFKFRVLRWLLVVVSVLSVWQVFFGYEFESHFGTINFIEGQKALAF